MLARGYEWARPEWATAGVAGGRAAPIRVDREAGRVDSAGAGWRLLERVERLVASAQDAARADGIYLVPLRAFIGLGWMRAFAEKATDPGWRDGSSLSAFLLERLQGDDIAFPAYEALVADAFLPQATGLGWVVMVGQFLTGFAILCGGLTSAALLCGLFMNLNFLLAGVPDPSAFYIVIQAVLLLTGAGAILGLDARLAAVIRDPLLSAQPAGRASPATAPPVLAGAALLALAIVAYALPHVTDWSPAGSVHDPAMIFAILAGMAAAWSTLAALRAAGSRKSRTQPGGVRAVGGNEAERA